MNDHPQVALLIETSRGYGRDVALGIARYARLHGPWSFHLKPGDFEQVFPQQKYWRGSGVFARLANAKIVEELAAANLPTIALDMTDEQLSKSSPASKFTDLRVDSEAAAELAAAHLMERRYPNYAFVGSTGFIWSERRRKRFQEVIGDAGYETHVFEVAERNHGEWDKVVPRLADWIASLPKPVGVMACNDEHGLHVLDACRHAGLKAPAEVGVVGVDNDTLLCELCSPTLSSVMLNGVEGGYQAASWLNEMMKKGRNKHRTIHVGALRVVTRQSTDLVTVDHKQVAIALSLINESCGREVTADSVAEQAKVSRRELDALFRDTIGRSVAAEIQRVRLNHARRLLEETDYPVPDIAEAAGYSSASYMVQVFRRELNTTPAKYRVGVRLLSVSPPERVDGQSAVR